MQRGGEASLDHGRCSAHEVCTVCAPSPSRAGTRAPSPPARGPTPTTTQRRPTLHTRGTRGRELRGRPAMRSEIECATAARQATYTRAPSCARAPRAACPATWAEAGKGRCWHARAGFAVQSASHLELQPWPFAQAFDLESARAHAALRTVRRRVRLRALRGTCARELSVRRGEGLARAGREGGSGAIALPVNCDVLCAAHTRTIVHELDLWGGSRACSCMKLQAHAFERHGCRQTTQRSPFSLIRAVIAFAAAYAAASREARVLLVDAMKRASSRERRLARGRMHAVPPFRGFRVGSHWAGKILFLLTHGTWRVPTWPRGVSLFQLAAP